jgi:hypothetical protein
MRRRHEESWERWSASGRTTANHAKLPGQAIQVFTPTFELPQGLCLFRSYHVFTAAGLLCGFLAVPSPHDSVLAAFVPHSDEVAS